MLDTLPAEKCSTERPFFPPFDRRVPRPIMADAIEHWIAAHPNTIRARALATILASQQPKGATE